MIPKNYFNKIIMRTTSVILIVLLFLFLFFGKFNSPSVKVCCNQHFQCENPFYSCKNITLSNYNECKFYQKFNCEGQEICNIEFIKPNTCIKSGGDWFSNNLINIYLIILGLGLLLNHLKYKRVKNENKN